MYTYLRKVQYHETDKMGVAHHANYVKWMEESRTAFLESIGLPFQSVEALGIVSPVVGLSVEYKHPCTYGDQVAVEVEIEKYNGLEFGVRYTVKNANDGTLLATATSRHCFLKDGRIISLKKNFAALHAAFVAALTDGTGQ